MEIKEFTKIIEFSVSEIHKIMKTIKTNLINSRKHRIGFHHSYPLYPNKTNIYKSFSNIIDAHIVIPSQFPALGT